MVKVIILYLTTSYVLLQALALVVEPLHMPDWVLSLVVVLLALGFPVMLVFSWVFDITPDGLQVTARPHEDVVEKPDNDTAGNNRLTNVVIAFLLILVAFLAIPRLLHGLKAARLDPSLEKSIAVLPFANDSNDAANVYLINGLMESILNNLAKIEDLKVISRTSVEKYRDEGEGSERKLVPEIAGELQVNYIVEGSGQKYGNEIMLTVQLLEGPTDRHLWSGQYRRNTSDIIDLQIEVAKSIADEIHAIITPDEGTRIGKAPTRNQVAYDYYLKGNELFLNWLNDRSIGRGALETARTYFEKAIELDDEFALAYAELSMTYTNLNSIDADRNYIDEANANADLALLNDPQLAQSLFAKALFYIYVQDEARFAIPYLEHSLRYNPNFAPAIRELENYYFFQDTEKFLYYALKACQVDIKGKSRAAIAYDYRTLSRSLRYVGLFDEAEDYLEKAVEFESDPRASVEERVEILSDTKSDYQGAWELLTDLMQDLDSPAIDILRFVAQTAYFRRDWENADFYYRQVGDPFYWVDLGRKGAVCRELGKEEEAEAFFKQFEEYLAGNDSPHKYRLLAELQAYRGETDAALDNMARYAREENTPYWAIRFFKDDPMYDSIRGLPRFQELLTEIETKFWKNRDRIKAEFEKQGLL